MLASHMNAHEEHLLAISKIPANSGHSLHKGTPREAFIREFLAQHLNSTVAIGSGEIIDAASRPNQQRNQFDIVIYKRNYPKLDIGAGLSAFLAESVIATIEVKSTLDAAGVEQSFSAAHAAKLLRKSEVASFSAGYVPPTILSFVVAYDGPARMKTAYGWLKNCYRSRGIDEPTIGAEDDRTRIGGRGLEGIFVLGKGFLAFDNAPYGFTPGFARQQTNPNLWWTIADIERGSLMHFFLLLTVATSHLEGSWLDPLPYLANFKIDKIEFGS